MKKIQIDTSAYRRSHMKEPRGRGSWAFAFTYRIAFGNDAAAPGALWWTPGNTTYAEAKKLAAEEARRRGGSVAYVMP